MNNTRVGILQTYGLWLTDTLCIVLSFNLSFMLRFRRMIGRGPMFGFDRFLLVSILFVVAYNFFLDWNHDFFIRGYFREFVSICKFNLTLMAVDLAYMVFSQSAARMSRLVIARFFVFNLIFSYLLHVIMKRFLRSQMRKELNVRKVFVIAQQELMEQTIRRIRHSMGMDSQIVGAAYADETQAEPQGTVGGDVPLIGGMKGLTEAATLIPFDEVFINAPDISQKSIRNVIRGFETMGAVCHVNVELRDTGAIMSTVNQFGDYSVITYRKNVYSAKRLLVKRAMDIAGGLVGLLLTGILTIFLAPAIKLDSPGPVFFSQTRVGKNGRRFRIYKFRSMYADAEEHKEELLKDNEMDGLMFKIDDDPRVTKVGRFIRKTSLDEFPQFLNVLKGDMSLVGTRPPTEEEFSLYDENYRRRVSMTPGLTGIWQVSGRSDITDFDEVVRLDLQYIDNWSLMLDIKIILQTIVIVFTGKGAR